MNISPITGVDQAEVRQSDQVADTIITEQGLIQRYAVELLRLTEEVKLKRESLRSVLENDNDLVEKMAQANDLKIAVKDAKYKVMQSEQGISLKVQIDELKAQKKDIEETMSNHLANYHQITGSLSFDTTNGDQCDFTIKAKIKPSQLKLFEV